MNCLWGAEADQILGEAFRTLYTMANAVLVPSVVGSLDRYTLYCSCRRPCVVSHWNQVRACQVSNAASTRGYGTPEEVALVTTQTWNSWSFDISRYLNLSPPQKNRNS
jgi:hypothetical protein